MNMDRGDYYEASFDQRSAAWDEAEAALEPQDLMDWMSECENTATHDTDITIEEAKDKANAARELACRRAWEGELVEFAAEVGTMRGYLNIVDMGPEYWKNEFAN